MSYQMISIGEDEFVLGGFKYTDRLPHEDKIVRITIPIMIEGSQSTTLAAIDTGANYCILDPAEVEHLNTEDWEIETKIIGGGRERVGKKGKIRIAIYPDEEIGGKGIQIEVIAWIPNLVNGEKSDLPNLIGYKGCLEIIRFAVDLQENLFYFGCSSHNIIY